MDLALVGARLLLAAVFAVTGLAKLADRAGSRQLLAELGLAALGLTAATVLLLAAGHRPQGYHVRRTRPRS